MSPPMRANNPRPMRRREAPRRGTKELEDLLTEATTPIIRPMKSGQPQMMPTLPEGQLSFKSMLEALGMIGISPLA